MAFAFHSELSKMLLHIAVKTKRRQLQHIEWKAEQFRCRFHLREANASLKFNIKFDKTLYIISFSTLKSYRTTTGEQMVS